MTDRAYACRAAGWLLCALAALAFAAPAAQAQTPGGVEAPPAGSQPGVISADGPVAISVRAGTMIRKMARFRGTVPATEAGRTITVERFDDASATWVPVTGTIVAADGSYLARWRADQAGRHRVRAVLQRPGEATTATASAELEITIHRPRMATWYGPGFYGRRTACGLRMSRTLLGVAHKTLPCGTPVSFLYEGRTITVPVVDRGPFARGMVWDLTSAAATALGFEHTDRVGAVRLAPPAPGE